MVAYLIPALCIAWALAWLTWFAVYGSSWIKPWGRTLWAGRFVRDTRKEAAYLGHRKALRFETWITGAKSYSLRVWSLSLDVEGLNRNGTWRTVYPVWDVQLGPWRCGYEVLYYDGAHHFLGLGFLRLVWER